MDVQDQIVARIEDSGPLLERLQAAIAAARDHDVPVIYVAWRSGAAIPR